MIESGISPGQILLSLSKQQDPRKRAFFLCDFIAQRTFSNLVCYYSAGKDTDSASEELELMAKVGLPPVPRRFSLEDSALQVSFETHRAVVQTSTTGPFPEVLLGRKMQSGIAQYCPTVQGSVGFLIANHNAPFHYTADFIGIIEQLTEMVFCYQGGGDG